MRTFSSKTDFWVHIWILILCVISFAVSVKEAIEDKPDWLDICVYFLLSIFFIVQVIRAKNKMKND